MLLILDLDETLIFSSETMLYRPEDFRVGDYYTYKRPGLEAFLDFAFRSFDVAVWTSSEANYARAVIDSVFPLTTRLKFVWARDRCTPKTDTETRQTYWVKDLKKVKRAGFALDRVLVIDDSPEKLERNYGNHVRVEPYYGSDTESELSRLQDFLKELSGVSDVRTVEKRGWQRRNSGTATDA